MSSRIVAVIILAIPTGLVCSIFATVLFCILRKTLLGPYIRRGLLKKAIAENHVVEAKLISSKDIYNETWQEVGIYAYAYNGQKYRYRGVSYNRLPQSITLYFEKNPKRACPSKELGLHESPWLKVYCISSVIIAIVTFLIGMCSLNG